MAFIELPVLGRVEFEPTPEGWWEFMFPYAPGPVEVDFNIDGNEITEAQARRVERFVADIGKFDRLARAAIRADYEGDPDGECRLYHTHHLEELNAEERLSCFGDDSADSIGAGKLLASLKLERMGLYPDGPESKAILDYSIGPDVTQYVLAVYFDEQGEVLGASMES